MFLETPMTPAPRPVSSEPPLTVAHSGAASVAVIARVAPGAASLVIAAGASLGLPAQAAQTLSPPSCAAMAEWAARFNRDDEWRPSPISDRHRFARLFAEEETTRQFGKPMVDWTEADVQAVRQSVLACRRETKDRELSGRYNQIQSALSSRVINFARESGPARERAAAAMAKLADVPPSPALLRLKLLLAKAGNLEGYRDFQRAAGSLPPQAMAAAAPARELATAMRALTADDLARIVTAPAEKAAAGMREGVVSALIADLGKIPADPNGLVAVQQARASFARDDADLFTPPERQRIETAITQHHAAIGEAIATRLIDQLGKSSTELDNAFTDLDQRSAPQLVRLLPPAQADRVRQAVDARRNAVTDLLNKRFGADLAGLPEDEASLERIDEARAAIRRWPASASQQTPRFLEAADKRRETILAAVNRKEAGAMASRVYQSSNGRHKLEFVDRKRVLISNGDNTMPANYVEEKDGRVSITGENLAVTLSREGRTLRGWAVPITRTK